VCNFKKATNAAAVLEWAVAFVFTFYVFSFFIDLLPAVRGKNYASERTAMEMEQNDPAANSERVKNDGYIGNGATNGVNGTNGRYVQSGYTNGNGYSNGNGYTNGNGYANGSGHANGNGFVANEVHYSNGPKPGIATAI
jgi:hypothetical protein